MVDVACVVAEDALPTDENAVAPVLVIGDLADEEVTEELDAGGDEDI